MPARSVTDNDLRSILADMMEGAATRLRRGMNHDPELQLAAGEEPPQSLLLPTDEKLTLTVAEAARRLGISRSSAYEAVRSGVIPSLRMGRRLLVPVNGLHRRLQELSK